MRAVRCDVCGAKALVAAATCPKCGHEFNVRDGFGALLPLAYCSSCHSYYPERLGQCKWCGTKPERPPIGPNVSKLVGAAALVVLVVGALFARGDGSSKRAAQAQPGAASDTAVKASAETGSDSVSRTTVASSGSVDADSVAPSDTASASPGARLPDGASDGGGDAAEPTSRGAAPVTAPREEPVRKEPVRKIPPTAGAAPTARRPVASPKPQVRSTRKPAPVVASSKARGRVKWVSAISLGWVSVRASATRDARVVASVGPSTRVQLGESRGQWRRIRARGVSGWVERGSLFDLEVPRRASHLAAR